jgi:hypothetical protein
MTNKRWSVDQDHDLRVAPWRVATLIYGEDDGSMERDDIECQIQEVIAQSFDYTTVNDGSERRAECPRCGGAAIMDGDIDDVLDFVRSIREDAKRTARKARTAGVLEARIRLR